MERVILKHIPEKIYAQHTLGKKISFLQTVFWAKFREKIANYFPSYYIIYDDHDVIGGFVALNKIKRVLGVSIKASYIPRTLFFFDERKLLSAPILKKVLINIKKMNVLSIVEFNYPHWNESFCPPDKFSVMISSTARGVGGMVFAETIQPKETIIKTVTEKDMLSSFSSCDARRNCKRGLKKIRQSMVKFVVKQKLSEDELKRAYCLICSISQNRGFKTRSYEYFKDFQKFIPNTIWFLFVDGKRGDEIILANLGIVERETMTYYDLYVGRDVNYDKMYISYLLKYYSFEYLKKTGIKYYDHWGIDLDKKSPKYGFSVFKTHFGGFRINFPPLVLLGNPVLSRLFVFLKGAFYL